MLDLVLVVYWIGEPIISFVPLVEISGWDQVNL